MDGVAEYLKAVLNLIFSRIAQIISYRFFSYLSTGITKAPTIKTKQP
jgi:hypothetical protein